MRSGDRRERMARPLLVTANEAARIADVFDLLSDPNRVRVLFALLEAGEMCVCDLAEMVDMSQSALSHGLRLLRTAGVVAHRRDGRMMRYRLADSHVRLLLDVTRGALWREPRLRDDSGLPLPATLARTLSSPVFKGVWVTLAALLTGWTLMALVFGKDEWRSARSS